MAPGGATRNNNNGPISAVYPVEVKSATNTKAKSLKVYMDAYNPPFAVKSSLKNYSGAGSVRSVPLYALGLLLGRMIG